MIRWLRWRLSNADDCVVGPSGLFAMTFVVLWGVVGVVGGEAAPAAEQDPVTFHVLAINPSDTEVQTTDVKLYLPQEVTPRDVLDLSGLSLEYDDEKSSYFVYKPGVELAPGQTKIYDVVVQDIWRIPEQELTSLGQYTDLVLGRLQQTEYAQTGRIIAEAVRQQLQEITAAQTSALLSRRQQIGAYRGHRLMLAQVKEDLARMEKLLTFTGGPPVPEMLQESRIKSDAPSTKTTWLLVIMIMAFLGFIGGLFFLTWHRRAQMSHELDTISHLAFSAPTRHGNHGEPVLERPQKVA